MCWQVVSTSLGEHHQTDGRTDSAGTAGPRAASTGAPPAKDHGWHDCASAQIGRVPHDEPPDLGARRGVGHTASVSPRGSPRAQTRHGTWRAPPEQLPYLKKAQSQEKRELSYLAQAMPCSTSTCTNVVDPGGGSAERGIKF